MKTLSLKIFGLLAMVCCMLACSKDLKFLDTLLPHTPETEGTTAKLLWIGPQYKVAIQAKLTDEAGISKIRIENGEWLLDTTFTLKDQTSYTLKDTFLVAKDVNPTEHTIVLTITNNKGGMEKTEIAVEDLSAENQIAGYNPDLVPPSITITKPSVTKFLGFANDSVRIDLEAAIEDEAIASIEVRVWGETAAGEAIEKVVLIEPENEADTKEYAYVNSFNLPGGKPGQYQYVVKSVDVSGNKKSVGGNITIGYVDRLYLSDAETEAEVANQGYDHMGGCRGIGTLISMKKQGDNVFTANLYYPNAATDNIRFVAFMGNERPFTQAKVNYTLNGANVVAMSAANPGQLTTDLSAASFKLPTSQSGYYTVTVDLTAKTVQVNPLSAVLNASDATKYPGWSETNPWPYLAVTGTTVVGTLAWTEVGTSPKLMRDEQNKYLFSGTFQSNTSSSNMSFNAPLSVLGGDVWGRGWFRMVAARNAMKDDYGDLVTTVGAVGASGGGANWGFSTSPAGTYKASYDIFLQRLRLVRVGD